MKKNFILQISDEARSDLAEVAKAAHTTDNQYAAMWVHELAQLKPEFALKVLGLIPPEWKYRRPGRPSTSSKQRETESLDSERVA